jgi:carbonic anhydrase
MEHLVRGIHHFQTTHFYAHRELFNRLSEGQRPDTLMITCSDSRIAPNLLLQTQPGDIFVLRNAGNIIPPFGAVRGGGEAATIEYAIKALGINHLIVMGHSNCGAMDGLLHPEQLEDLPSVIHWLEHASATRTVIKECYGDLDGQELMNAAIKENVLVQLDNLRTYPAVAGRLTKGELTMHGWVYEIASGKILAFDPASSHFAPITSQGIPAAITSRQPAERNVRLAPDLNAAGNAA